MYTKLFNDISKNDSLIAGGKGASLGEMTQAGIDVPPGFVILADSFDSFIEQAGLEKRIDAILKKLDYDKPDEVEKASKNIRKIILDAKTPDEINDEIASSFKKLNCKYVAVRSSATAEDSSSAAWAGQLDSYLNTTSETLMENIKKCWASLYTARAIIYRREKKLTNKKISVAVVVQKMIDSEKSGIAFSVHPVTNDPNQIIIEAGFGLGEAIVSGQITPDSYIVDKTSNEIIEINIQQKTRGLFRSKKGGNEWRQIDDKLVEQQALTNEEITKLARVISKIEKHYGFPCDIEWAIEDDRIFILQSRPITTLEIKKSRLTLADKFLEKLGDKKIIRIQGDFMPFLLMVDWFNYYDPDGKIHNIYPGLLYFTKNRTVGYLTEDYSESARRTLSDIVSGKISINYMLDNYFISAKKVVQYYEKCFIEDVIEKQTEVELMKMYHAVYQEIREYVAWTLFIEQMDENVVNSVACRFKITNIDKIWNILKIPHFPSLESRNKIVLLDVLKGDKPLDYLYFTLANYTFTPEKEHLDEITKSTDIKELESEINESLSRLEFDKRNHLEKVKQLSSKENRFMCILSQLMQLRDERKDILSMSEFTAYRIARKLFAIWGLDTSLVNVTGMCEVDQGRDKILSIAKDLPSRVDGVGLLWNPDQSFEIESNDFDSDIATIDGLILSQNLPIDNILRGEIGNSGKVTGKVRVLLKNHQFSEFRDGEILVTGMTRPEFVPLMKKAAAIITDEGGVTSHAAIVSRELNVPCITGTKIATQLLKTGDTVEVNANSGIVQIIN